MKKHVFLYLIAVPLVSLWGCTCGSSPESHASSESSDAAAEIADDGARPNLPRVPAGVAASSGVNRAAETEALSTENGQRDGATDRSGETMVEKWRRQEQRIADSPFELSIASAYLSGRCARGPVPENRGSTGGIVAQMKGTLTYTGKDLLMEASIEGALVIHVNGMHQMEIPFRSVRGKKKSATAVLRKVRGADPWVEGQSRGFVVETVPFSEAFCEFVPREVKMHVAIKSLGVASGWKSWPVTATPFHFEEVVGMALDQQVQLKDDDGFIPADGHVTILDRILVTRLDGTTEWIRRADVAYLDGLAKANGPTFPVDVKTENWKVSVKEISSVKTFGDISPRGEDEFLAALEVTITNLTGEKRSAEEVKLQLETSPNQWRKPLAGPGLGKLPDPEVAPSETLKTTAVFPRYRFERPTRLRVDTPGSSAMYLDVFSYRMGPERSPLSASN
jgi:hypothetical protein